MSDPTTNLGICYLVGAGPGDPGLLTVKGRDCIEMADVLIYDALSSPKLLKLARPDCELIYAGKRAANHAIPQSEINQLCVQKTQEGKIVTRLKGGDPLIFGRGGEEAAELAAAAVPFEIVPGISSGVAGPAYAGIPVTHRDHCSQLTLLTGHEDPTKEESSLDYAHLAKTPGTLCFYMGMSRIAIICQKLIDHGAAPDTPAAIVRWGTTAQQESTDGTLSTLPQLAEEQGLKSPAIIVIGDVVKERATINWFENRPLFGKKIIVTRTQAQASQLSAQLTALGADVIELPTIKIAPPQDPAALSQSAQDAHRYDWLIFTSPNGVERFFETYFAHFDDARSLGLARIAAIGPATAAKLRQYRFKADLIPDKHVAEGLIDAFKKESIENQTLLWVKAEETRNVISDELTKLGAIIDTAVAYRTIPENYDESSNGLSPEDDPNNPLTLIREKGADYITFTSASTVEHFHTLLNNHDLDWPENAGTPALPVSIGPITTQALEEAGHANPLTAETHDIPHLIKTLQQHATA